MVDVQKSSRSIVSVCRSCSPSSLTTITLDFLPKGGFVITTRNRTPGSAARLSAVRTGGSASSAVVGPMPWSRRSCSRRRNSLLVWVNDAPEKVRDVEVIEVGQIVFDMLETH